MTHAKFAKYLGKSKKRHDLLNQYKDTLSGASRGRMKGGKLIGHVMQNGGSWLGFTNWVKNTASNAWDYVKKKPISTIGTAVGLAGNIPGLNYLKPVGTAIGLAGTALGKGVVPSTVRNAKMSGSGKVLMVF